MYGGYGGGIEDGYARIFGFTESGFTEEKISYLHNENGRYEYNKDYFLEAEPTQPPVALHN